MGVPPPSEMRKGEEEQMTKIKHFANCKVLFCGELRRVCSYRGFFINIKSTLKLNAQTKVESKEFRIRKGNTGSEVSSDIRGSELPLTK